MHVSRSVCCTTEGVKHVWNTEALSTVKKSREQLPDPHGPLNTDGKVPSSVLTKAFDKSDAANSSKFWLETRTLFTFNGQRVFRISSFSSSSPEMVEFS